MQVVQHTWEANSKATSWLLHRFHSSTVCGGHCGFKGPGNTESLNIHTSLDSNDYPVSEAWCIREMLSVLRWLQRLWPIFSFTILDALGQGGPISSFILNSAKEEVLEDWWVELLSANRISRFMLCWWYCLAEWQGTGKSRHVAPLGNWGISMWYALCTVKMQVPH